MPTWISIDQDEQHGPQLVEADDNFMRENVGAVGEGPQQSSDHIHTRKCEKDAFMQACVRKESLKSGGLSRK